MATGNHFDDSLDFLPVSCLSHTVPSATVDWIPVEPEDPRKIPHCVAVRDQDGWWGPNCSSNDDPVYAKVVTREPEVDDCEDLMVGRAFNTGSNYIYEESPYTLVPGTVINGRTISIGSGWETFDYNSYEMLTVKIIGKSPGSINGGSDGNSSMVNTGIHWKKCRSGIVPKYAVKGGISQGGDMLYIGRNAGSLTVGRNCKRQPFPLKIPPERFAGRVYPRLGKLLVPFRGSEYFYDEYEVLALNQSPASLQVLCRNLIVRQCSNVTTNDSISRGPKSLPSTPPASFLSLALPSKLIRFLESLWPVDRRRGRNVEGSSMETTGEGGNEVHEDEFFDEYEYLDQLINKQPIDEETLHAFRRDIIIRAMEEDSRELAESDRPEEDDVRYSDSDSSEDNDENGDGVSTTDGWNSQLFPDILSRRLSRRRSTNEMPNDNV